MKVCPVSALDIGDCRRGAARTTAIVDVGRPKYGSMKNVASGTEAPQNVAIGSGATRTGRSQRHSHSKGAWKYELASY